ncbi:hypothetical protein [Bailinhaonella thermotolerans]|uniref:Uncharacterized protein n=1 Tax=Bailinhaonella thermotolerans TaxID=1070861 RepID=A0A3A4B7F9_9ACTN|nr:hypothetical protein [Bailinhaonella thermotolerans]RJL34507.1 hypothetical protein D5H75_08835 [Bailinhaonella thermotolerans]
MSLIEWLKRLVRRREPVPAGGRDWDPRDDDGPPPGGVREPRRPKPAPPGSAQRLPEPEPPVVARDRMRPSAREMTETRPDERA